MKFIHVLPLLSAAALFALPRISYAQFCVPGTPICAGKDGVTVTGPGVNQGAGAGGSTQGNAGGTAQGQGGITLPNVTVTPPKVDYTVQWQAYAAWRAQIQATVKGRIRAQIEAEIAANLRVTLPNPYLGLPLTPRYEGGGGGASGALGGARGVAIGLLGLVVGDISGRKSPIYVGYTLPIRVPVGDDFRIATDLSMVAMNVEGTGFTAANGSVRNSSTFGAFQVRPALINDIVRSRTGSGYAYWRAGAHLTTPTGGGANSPDFFYGPSAGVGLQGGSTLIVGAEWNVDGWAAVGSKKDPDYNRFRVGTDLRIWVGLNL
jgi:hypothetical protein